MRALTRMALLLAALATPQAAPRSQQVADYASPIATLQALPQQLDGFQRSGSLIDYAQRTGNPGLGASARYVPSSGERVAATIYIYDRGRPRQPAGANSPDVEQELHATAGELNAMVRAGRYQLTRPEGGMNVGAPSAADSAKCLTFTVTQGDGARTGDAVCVTVQRGQFLKVRVTSWNPPEPTAAGLFAVGLLKAVQSAPASRQPSGPAKRF